MSTGLNPRLASPATGVIVTGGASGIGLASARALAAVGRPVALWDINAAKAEAEAQGIAAAFSVAAIGQAVDLRDTGAYAAAIAASRAAMGSIGGLVHSAGVVDQGSLDGLTEEVWADGINTHLRPLALLCRDLLGDFQANPGSAVVGIASINATLGNWMNPAYTASKGGMLSLVRSLADDLGRVGVRVNAVSPGQIRTPMMQPVLDHLSDEAFTKRILLGRIGEPREIAAVVRFLLSEEASYVTAAEIVVDGGNISSQRV